MNILIPDSWLRKYLKTTATPKQIKEYLSLCGPSVERINNVNGEIVYDVEVTTNRPDAMSVVGIAREAAAILPQFKIKSSPISDPYQAHSSKIVKSFVNTIDNNLTSSPQRKLHIKTDHVLNPRWVSVVIDNVRVKESPRWLAQALEMTGIRPINNIVDITNYIMRSYGQPVHAFDYDEIKPGKNGTPTMILRSAKDDEEITTLDAVKRTLQKGDIVIEDGSGRLIDLCGIMGAENSSIKDTTKTIVLFMQTYNPLHIRKTSMRLALRSEAAQLFEKGVDEELVLPAMIEGIKLTREISGGKTASQLYDIYPTPYKPKTVNCPRTKIDAYVGVALTDSQIKNILTTLGFKTVVTPKFVTVTVPSFRRDIGLDVDIIEEIARLYGYHTIKTKLPQNAPPVVIPDAGLRWEEEIKIRLRDWGYTETYTYSMISESIMNICEMPLDRAYKIANPLSADWEYMRPHVLPSMLPIIAQNQHIAPSLSLFELSMAYDYRPKDLPHEISTLVVIKTGESFLELKGVAQRLYELLGISYTPTVSTTHPSYFQTGHTLSLGEWGRVGKITPTITEKSGIKAAIYAFECNIAALVKHIKNNKTFVPISKYSPIIEDFTFVLPPKTYIGAVIDAITATSKRISRVDLVSYYQNARTFRVTFSSAEKQLTSSDIESVRTALIEKIRTTFGAQLK